MAKDIWDKFKIISDILKNNWPMIVLAFTTLGSAYGNMSQYFEKDEIVEAKNKQIKAIAEYYNPPKPVKVTLTQQPDGTWKTEIKKIDTKLTNFEKKYDRNMREFHGVK
jgi:hypothetical protein